MNYRFHQEAAAIAGGVFALAGLACAAAPGVPALDQGSPVPTVSTLGPDVKPAPVPPGFTLQYEQTFDSPDTLKGFRMTDPSAWKHVPLAGGGALELIHQSKYTPPVRSPVNVALIADRQFGDFVLECDLLQTGREYGHRDMCVFFGLQNPTNFYYVHIATAADDHAHNVFLVRNAPRTKIARETTKGVQWGLNIPHRVRVERRLAEGAIKVFFDDLTQPIMQAEDRSFGAGAIGFGSFDDTGRVDNIRIWGPSMETNLTPYFAKP